MTGRTGKADQRPDDPNEGLSLLYRLGYRIQYTLLHIFGPAQLPPSQNPHVRMERNRALRVAQAKAKRLAAQGQADGD